LCRVLVSASKSSCGIPSHCRHPEISENLGFWLLQQRCLDNGYHPFVCYSRQVSNRGNQQLTYFATLVPLVAEKGTNPLFHHGVKNFCRALWEQRLLLLSSFMLPTTARRTVDDAQWEQKNRSKLRNET
jgi:hypothetical protein